MKKAIVTTILTILMAYTTYAATQVWFHQELAVPAGSIKLYKSDGVTEITSGSDQSSIWTWNTTANGFNATIYVKNDGQSTVNVGLSCTNLATGWTFHYYGDLNNIPAGQARQVSISVQNPSALAGDTTGDFTITASII